jgi:hypothetical protein
MMALWRVPAFLPAGLPLQPGENRPSCSRPALAGSRVIRSSSQNLSSSSNSALIRRM